MRCLRRGCLQALAIFLILCLGALLLVLTAPSLTTPGVLQNPFSWVYNASTSGNSNASLKEAVTSDTIEWCQPLSFLTTPLPTTALVSFAGSGNTWMRYLLQQASGVYTGSVRSDVDLRNKGFPAEGVFNGSVVVVKTHEYEEKDRRPFARAVLLLRDPADAILAEFNRKITGGHVSLVEPNRFTRNGGKEWNKYFRKWLLQWRNTNLDWAQKFKGPLLLVRYEDLLRDPGPPLSRTLRFLGINITEDAMRCTLEHSTGIYRRPRRNKPIDPYLPWMKKQLAQEKKMVFEALRHLTSSDDLDADAAASTPVPTAIPPPPPMTTQIGRRSSPDLAPPAVVHPLPV